MYLSTLSHYSNSIIVFGHHNFDSVSNLSIVILGITYVVNCFSSGIVITTQT